MSDLAGRPLTFITTAMYQAARDTGGAIWRRLSWCGRYYVFQAYTHADVTEHARMIAAGWVMVADVDDLWAYGQAYGGDLMSAGRAIVDASRS